MHWKCLFVFKNTCNLKQTTLWLFALIIASTVFLCTMCISLYLPACVYDAGIREQRGYSIEMLEDSFASQSRDLAKEILLERLRNNVSRLSRELRQLRATVNIYEKLGKLIEKDSSLAKFGSKRHQNLFITSVPHSGDVLLGELFNQHHDVFYLFEPFHSLKYFRENRPPEVYTSILSNFIQGIFSCDFSKFHFYTEFLSRHYRAVVHRLASRTLSSPPLCPEVVYGRYYNIRYCTRLRPPTLTAICKVHGYTAVKTTQIVDMERLMQLEDNTRDSFRVVELVRDPRAILHAQLQEGLKNNGTELWVTYEARKTCKQHLRNRRYVQNRVHQSDRYIMIKYEDLVSCTPKVFENLYSFLGLSRSARVSSWFNGVLEDGLSWPTAIKDGDIDNNSTRKKVNLTRSVSEWQSGLKLWQIRTIERECLEAMEELGYEIFNDTNYSTPYMHIL